jgi:hypothetical protein
VLAASEFRLGSLTDELRLDRGRGARAVGIAVDRSRPSALPYQLSQLVVVIESPPEVQDAEDDREEKWGEEREFDNGGATLRSR